MPPRNLARAIALLPLLADVVFLKEQQEVPQLFVSLRTAQTESEKPAGKYIDLTVGANLTLYCQGLSPLAWSYPDIDARHLGQQFRFSNSRPIQTFRYDNETGLHRSDLHLAFLTVNDTGQVTCHYRDQKRKRGLFLFVRSSSQLHVGSRPIYIMVVGERRAVVPCIATSSKTRTELLIGGKKAGPNIAHHDKFKGFEAISASVEFSKEMECRFINEHGNFTQIQLVYVDFAKPGVEEQKPVIEVASGRRTFLTSEHVELLCRANTSTDAYNYTTLEWSLPRGSLDDRTTRREQTCSAGSEVASCVSTLSIPSIEHTHGGRYRCTATHHDLSFSVDSPYFNLQVIENALTKLIRAQDVVEVVLHGTVVTLNVSIESVPVPTAKWLKDGRVLQSNTTDGKHTARIVHQNDTQYLLQLSVNNITLHDAGNYTLQIGTGRKTASLHPSTKVTVNAPPTLIVQPSIYEVTRWLSSTSREEFHCTGNGYPTPTVRWQYQECRLPGCETNASAWQDVYQQASTAAGRSRDDGLAHGGGGNDDGDAPFASLNMSESLLLASPKRSAVYRCIGENKMERVASRTMRLIISEIAADVSLGFATATRHYTVVEGDVFRLTCYASKWLYSQPEIVWRREKNSQYSSFDLGEGKMTMDVHESNHSYVTEVGFNVSFDVSAVYACRAKNTNTNIPEVAKTRSVTLDVVAIRRVSVFSSTNLTTLTVNVGSTAIITCTFEGKPTPVMTWLKNGAILNTIAANVHITSSDAEQNLTIPRVHATDSGVYTCLATNKYGSALLNTTLYVFETSPQIQETDIVETFNFVAAAAVAGSCAIFSAIVIALFLRFRKMKKPSLPCELLLPSKVAINPDIPIDEQTDCLPYDASWEFPRERLRLGSVLGQGAFGRVLRAEAAGIERSTAVSTVAVKTVRDPDNMDQIKALISELKILIHVGQHLNIVNLLGAVTRNLKRGELLVIVEYCRYGNLRNYLLEHRSDYVDTLDTASGRKLTAILSKPPPHGSMPRDSGVSTLRESVTSEDYLCPISLADGQNRGVEPLTKFDLLCWCYQIARGMEYLASIQYIHRDLAARNVLLCDDNVVKICDFGLAKDIYKYNEYKKTTDGPLPIKWMALESLTHKLFTTASDVWSFGVTLWELFSMAATPYPGIELNEIFLERLQSGYRMEQPKHSPDDVYYIMIRCWHPEACKRPTFSELSIELGNMLQESVRNRYLALEEPYILLREPQRPEPRSRGPNRRNCEQQEYDAIEDYLEPLSFSQASPGSEVAPSEATFATRIHVDDDGYYNALLIKETRKKLSKPDDRDGVEPSRAVELCPLVEVFDRGDHMNLGISQTKLWATSVREDERTVPDECLQKQMQASAATARSSEQAVETVC